jgi:hypothetical protein
MALIPMFWGRAAMVGYGGVRKNTKKEDGGIRDKEIKKVKMIKNYKIKKMRKRRQLI